MQKTSLKDRSFADLPGGRSTAYLEKGAGQALVLVHGVGLNASVWAPQVEAFAGDYRVVTYDTLGHGASALPTEAAGLPEYVDQLRCLLDALEIESASMIGHSMGALIASLFAIEHPDRVETLIAANPVYRRPPAQLATSRARARALAEHGAEAALDEALARWFGESGVADSGQVRQVRQWISETDPRGYARAYRVFSEADPWLAGRLVSLCAPALFITGELDPNSTPEMARAMATEAPLGHVRVLDGERHMMAYVSPDRFNAAVGEFINRIENPDASTLSPRQARQA